ncbi:MAG: hypothetical protein MN733_00915 [Nitrososphaera sp.]|nr:hypothetical protein [Nitrososphaera sp.]
MAKRKYVKRLVVLAMLAGCSLGILYVLREPVKELIKTYVKGPFKEVLKTHEPFRSFYVWYFKPPVFYLSPAEVGDGKQALEIILQDPASIGVDTLGRVYIADRGRYLWRIDSDGRRAHIIAGSGKEGSVPTRVHAREAGLGSPEGLCLDEAGNVYFADAWHHVVLKLDQRGSISRIAGNGASGYNGDGGLAVEASLNLPYDVARDSTGNLYIADFDNHRIRKVDPQGRISTVAGTGIAGYSGDGGPAAEAQLNGPYGVLVDAEDNILIADSLNHIIRKVGPSGEITTIAGTGSQGYSGDGGPAIAATFDTPQSLFVGPHGQLYIGDEHNHCIRVIDSNGTISTLAGNGHLGEAADGTISDRAQLNDPEDMWVMRDGRILIADADNRRILVILPDGKVYAFAGKGQLE